MVRSDEAPDDPTEEDHHGRVEDDRFADGVDGVEAIDDSQERNERVHDAFGRRDMRRIHQRANGGHGNDVRHQNRHHGQVREQRELLERGGRCRQQADTRLDDGDDHQADRRRTEAIDLVEDTRIEAFLRGQLEELGDRELPTESTTRARDHQEATDHATNFRREHVRKHKTQRSVGVSQFQVRDDTGDDVRGQNVDDGHTHRGKHHGQRHVLLRIFDGVGVRTGRFKTQESPKRHGNRSAHGIKKRRVVRVPSTDIHVPIEPEPTGHGQEHDRSDHTPNGVRAQTAAPTVTQEVTHAAEPQKTDRDHAGFDRVQLPAKARDGVTHRRGQNGHHGDHGRNGVTVTD